MKPLIGIFGLTAIQGVAEVPPITPMVEIGKLLIQVILGVATLWKMFKKDKPQREDGSYINQNQTKN